MAALLAAVVASGAATVAVVGSAPGTAAGSTGSAATVTSVTVPTGTTTQMLAAAPVVVAVAAEAILDEVAAAGTAAGGTITAVVLAADGTPLVVGPDAGEQTYTASLVKILVVGQLLAQDAAGALTLSADDLALMERAVTASDDTAMSILWDRYDGARLVTDGAAVLGLSATAPPDVAGQWGQPWTTAADVATALAAVDDWLGPEDAATLLGWMRATSATAADGFDQQFGLLGVATEQVAAKQGWMCCVDGRRQLHSAAVLGDGRVVVLLGDFPAATSWSEASTALDRAAAAVLAGLR
ncbi:serine hydrolase [Blastococcus sp. SYSU DS0619]